MRQTAIVFVLGLLIALAGCKRQKAEEPPEPFDPDKSVPTDTLAPMDDPGPAADLAKSSEAIWARREKKKKDKETKPAPTSAPVEPAATQPAVEPVAKPPAESQPAEDDADKPVEKAPEPEKKVEEKDPGEVGVPG